MKWGKIPDEHLEMRDFPADTNASAVILCDYGTVTFDRSYGLRFERHRRIKILTEAGFDWGTFSITYLAEDRAERVRKIRGQTFVLGEDGKVRRHKLSRRDIFDEDVDGRLRRTRFTLPALEAGAVVEYRYQIRAKNPFFMPDWSFQTSEPTLWSEFRPEIPERLRFVRATRGMSVPLHIEESNKALRPDGDTYIHRMVYKDVPALREEPYMTTPNDYRATIELQLSGFVEPGFGLRKVLNTWDEAASDLRAIPRFKHFYDPPSVARNEASRIVAGLERPAEKLQAIYDYVRSNISWTGRKTIIPGQDVDEVLTKKTGDSADIALLLGALLRAAGLEANPVLISSRSHGAVTEMYPILNQFNYAIVHATIGGKSHMLDATDPLRPFELLPLEAIVGRGWMVTDHGQEWIGVSSAGRFDHDMEIDAEVQAGGDVKLSVKTTDRGYSALEARTALQENEAGAFVSDVLLEGREATDVGAFAFNGMEDVGSPLSMQGEAVLPVYAQVAGDMVYFNPRFLGRIDENPFRLPERTFPVDYGYPSSRTYTVRLTVPEGYEILEMPSNIRLQLPMNSGRYHRSSNEENGVYVIETTFEISKSVFRPGEYPDLRAFYERVVGLEAEQVVLRRAPAGPLGEGE